MNIILDKSLFFVSEISKCTKDVENSTNFVDEILRTREDEQKKNKNLDGSLEYCKEDTANITASMLAPPHGAR